MTKPMLLATLAATLLWGCSNQNDGAQVAGSGGQAGSAGNSATGGTLVTGGSSTAGGAFATGGSSTAGHTSATGGTFATGGVSAADGSSATGGAAGTGGESATGGNFDGSGGIAGSSATGGRGGSGGTTATAGGAAGTSTGGGTSQAGATGTGGRIAADGSIGGGGSTAGASGTTSRFDASTPADGNGSDTNPTGGAGAYRPCPTDGTACKILPLGDSITYGVGSSDGGSYRSPLFKLMAGASQKTAFTGSVINGPAGLQVSGQTFSQRNEGHSGWGISEVNPNSGGSKGLTTVVPNPAFSSSSGGVPNIILLHIGTNDQGTYSATQVASDLGGLLDQITTAAPDALVVVAQIIPLGYGDNAVIKAYNQLIPSIVQTRTNAHKHIVTVDMFTGFNASTMIGGDKVHPNDTGYQFMAEHWYSTISSLLPK